MCRILEPSDEAIAAAADILRAGGVVAFPTETVYGIGADTYNPDAIAAVFKLKNRPTESPLSAHVSGAEQARRLVRSWDDRCERLTQRFWPGPLALILPKHDDVPHAATSGFDTIALRCPRHEVTLGLIEAFGSPISAASANQSGGVSPTLTSHVARDFPDAPDLMILDGGPCEIGLESTLLDLSQSPPRILRAGAVSAEELREVIGQVSEATPVVDRPHYAPRTPTELAAPLKLRDRLAVESNRGRSAVVLCFDGGSINPPHVAIEMSRDAIEYAQRIYHALHEADQSECDLIIIEQPPDTGEMWKVITGRLQASSSGMV